ncbi:hypothetical protein EMIT093MI4_30200 [Pseudomonas sp. IT-93MI4]
MAQRSAGRSGRRCAAEPGLQRVLFGGQTQRPERPDHQHRFQGPEERPVQDHQLLREEGPRPDEPFRDSGKNQRSCPAQAVRCAGLSLQRRAIETGQSGVSARPRPGIKHAHCTTLSIKSRAARTTSKIPRNISPFYWRHKIVLPNSNFSFTRQPHFFSVVARKFFYGSGTKLSSSITHRLTKAQIESAIKLRPVPSLAIFQKISDFAMSG